jgi:hypothetical protein
LEDANVQFAASQVSPMVHVRIERNTDFI